MERITISLDEDLAQAFDQLIATRGYRNRSEAVRDLLRSQLENSRLQLNEAKYCIANLSYVFNHHERTLAERLMHIQHDHHDLVVSTMHAHLDHENCIETVILRGPTGAVHGFAHALMAERGVRHGKLNVISLEMDENTHEHPHEQTTDGHTYRHVHLKPRS